MTQRFRGGLQFLGSYTYGKALDYGGSAASGGGAVGNPQTVTNLEAGHGPAGFDVRHRGVVSWVWELPWGPGRRWLSGRRRCSAQIVGGWQFAGIATVTTGRPFTVFMQTGVNNGAPSWPNRIGIGQARRSDRRSLVRHGAISSRRRRTPTATAAAASSTRPGHVNFDTSLSKRFALIGRTNAEFRWDAFNLFNHPGFGFPNQNFDCADRRTHHVHRGRQSKHAVLAEVQFLADG